MSLLGYISCIVVGVILYVMEFNKRKTVVYVAKTTLECGLFKLLKDFPFDYHWDKY